jgi:PAS domain S-box-containing protein
MPNPPKNTAESLITSVKTGEGDTFFRLLFERNPQPMWVHDVKTLQMLAVNEAALSKYGFSRPEFLALRAPDLQYDAYAETDGEEMLFQGTPARLVQIRDVTQERLQEEQEILAAVVKSTSNAIVGVDHAGQINLFNPAAERIFGYTRSAMQGKTLELLMPERYRAAHPMHRQKYAEEKGSSRMMGMGLVRGLRSDGVELDLEVTIAHVTVKARQMQIAVLKDVTERVRSTAVFEQSRAQLSELTQKLMTQEKTLVKRLAQTLHDQLGQTLAAVRMAHETIIALQGDSVTNPIDRLQKQMGLLISQAIRQVRQVLVDLRPPLLDEQGLAAALDNELRNRSLTQPKIDISIRVPPELALMRWPTEVEYAAFMVAREAVENALRHSGASAIEVELTGSPTALMLAVVDNGFGIEAGAAQKTGHLGMLGMQERAHAISATVTVDSDEEHGTRITFSWQPF